MQLQIECNIRVTKASLFVIDLKSVHEDLKKAITDAQCHYQTPVDKRCTPAPKIEVGNHIFILARFIRSIQFIKKLSEKYLGPFEVIEKLGTHSYLIKLPNHLHTIHPVFHVLQIESTPLSTILNRVNVFYPPWKLKAI